MPRTPRPHLPLRALRREAMQRKVVVRAKSVEEAVNQALQKLGASRDEARITIINKGHPGILGLGSQEAIIEVELIREQERANLAKGVLEDLLQLLGVEAEVYLREPDPDSYDNEEAPIILDIEGEDLGPLIGRHGKAMAALQYLTQIIVAQRADAWQRIIIDINGYQARRTNKLNKIATDTAERVKLTQRPFSLPPMPAHERRAIHLALADNPAVSTYSIGSGRERHVVISPRKGKEHHDINKRRQGG